MTDWVEPWGWTTNEVITAQKLNTIRQAILYLRERLEPFLTLPSLTKDPPLAPGILWFRSDLGEIRFSPDGHRILRVRLEEI
jgi:hypothetical protein